MKIVPCPCGYRACKFFIFSEPYLSDGRFTEGQTEEMILALVEFQAKMCKKDHPPTCCKLFEETGHHEPDCPGLVRR